MTTNNEVLAAALRKINVIAEGQTISGEQGLTCLPILNDMIEEWSERDIALGYFAQSDATATCPIPAWAERAVKANLAIAAAPAYSAPVSPDVVVEADQTFRAIQRKCMVEKLRSADMSNMPRGSGHVGSGWNITTDSTD